MNFGLSVKYSEIDFEEVSLSDLMLIGGGCGESGGGSTTVASAQATQQQVAAQPGSTSAYVNYSSPTIGGNFGVTVTYGTHTGTTVTVNANVEGSTGHVDAGAKTTTNPGGGFWSSVWSFFTSMFGSH
jgi:hypothetical protein